MAKEKREISFPILDLQEGELSNKEKCNGLMKLAKA